MAEPREPEVEIVGLFGRTRMSERSFLRMLFVRGGLILAVLGPILYFGVLDPKPPPEPWFRKDPARARALALQGILEHTSCDTGTILEVLSEHGSEYGESLDLRVRARYECAGASAPGESVFAVSILGGGSFEGAAPPRVERVSYDPRVD